MYYFYSVLVINVIVMVLSILIIRTLYSNNLIDKSTKNSLTILSIFIPIGAIVITVMRSRTAINHLVSIRELK
jgi:hypothetical protein